MNKASPRWQMATAATISVAVELNRVSGSGEIDLDTAAFPAQDELLARADTLIARLRKVGIMVMDPSDPDLQKRLSQFFYAVVTPEPPPYEGEWPKKS